jgi:hypothetical protein
MSLLRRVKPNVGGNFSLMKLYTNRTGFFITYMVQLYVSVSKHSQDQSTIGGHPWHYASCSLPPPISA